MIKLVIFDLDNTLWTVNDYDIITDTSPPYRKVSNDFILDCKGNEIKLMPKAIKVIKELSKRKIILSIASFNTIEPARTVLKLFRIYKYFKHPKLIWSSNKHLMIREMLNDFKKENEIIRPEEVIFIDDHEFYKEPLNKEFGGKLNFLVMHNDIKKLSEIFNFID